MTRIGGLLLAFALVGSIGLAHPAGPSMLRAANVEVAMGPLAPGSTGGPNGTEGAASVAATLVSIRTNALYLNNTNATGAWHARIEVANASGVSNLVALEVGIDNNTASVAQTLASLGVLTKTDGALVRLEPGSANKIYVTRVVGALGPTTRLDLVVVAADTPAERASVTTLANVTIA